MDSRGGAELVEKLQDPCALGSARGHEVDVVLVLRDLDLAERRCPLDDLRAQLRVAGYPDGHDGEAVVRDVGASHRLEVCGEVVRDAGGVGEDAVHAPERGAEDGEAGAGTEGVESRLQDGAGNLVAEDELAVRPVRGGTAVGQHLVVKPQTAAAHAVGEGRARAAGGRNGKMPGVSPGIYCGDVLLAETVGRVVESAIEVERRNLHGTQTYRRMTFLDSQLPRNCASCTMTTMTSTAAQVTWGSNAR